jgi:hypothetical protein
MAPLYSGPDRGTATAVTIWIGRASLCQVVVRILALPAGRFPAGSDGKRLGSGDGGRPDLGEPVWKALPGRYRAKGGCERRPAVTTAERAVKQRRESKAVVAQQVLDAYQPRPGRPSGVGRHQHHKPGETCGLTATS